MINLIGCITVLVLGLQLSNVESIGEREVKIITILGWLIALFFAKGGMWHVMTKIKLSTL